MARTSWGRTIVKTIVNVTYVDNENNIHRDVTLTLWGDYDIEGAQSKAKKILNAKGAIVDRIIAHESYYGKMSLEEFDKHCVKTNFRRY